MDRSYVASSRPLSCAVIETLEQRQLLSAQVNVRFAPDGTAAVAGFITDSGTTYRAQSTGSTYGWDQSNSAATFRRTGTKADAIRSTGIAIGDRKWEIALPNGQYRVRVVAGDATDTDNVYRIGVESNAAFLKKSGTKGSPFVETTEVVTLKDGRLTLYGAKGYSNPLAFVQITPVLNPRPALQPVEGLAFLAQPGAILLSWTDANDDETAYSIKRRDASNDFSEWETLATLPSNSSFYADRSARSNTNYAYRVVSRRGDDVAWASAYSTVALSANETRAAIGAWRHLVPGLFSAALVDADADRVYAGDSTAGNIGGQGIDSNIDVGRLASGELFVGWTTKGEWMEYSVVVPTSADYRFIAEVASAGVGGKFRVLIDGAPIGAAVGIPDTKSFTAFQTLQTAASRINAGHHVVRLEMAENSRLGAFVGNFRNIGFAAEKPYALKLDSTSWREGATVPIRLVQFQDLGQPSKWTINWGDGKSTTVTSPSALAELTHTYGSRASAVVTSSVTVNGKAYQLPSVSLAFIPCPVESITAKATGPRSLSIKWKDSSTIETSYVLELDYFDGEARTIRRTLPANTTSYTWTGLIPLRWYTARVLPTNAAGSDGYVVSDFARTHPDLATGIKDLKALYDSSTIALTWTAYYGNDAEYIIEQSSNGKSWTNVFRGPINVAEESGGLTRFSLFDALEDQKLSYRVRAALGTTYSPWSNLAAVLTPPVFPLNVRAEAITSDGFTVRWDDTNSFETKYRVGVARPISDDYDEPAWTWVDLPKNSTSYKVRGLASNTNYWFAVDAVNPAGSTFDPRYSHTHSGEATTDFRAAVPPIPESVDAKAMAVNRVEVRWTDVAGESGYLIERFDSAGVSSGPYGDGWVVVGSTSANVASFTDKSVQANHTYFYRVTARNTFNENLGPSEYDGATTSLQKPTTPRLDVGYDVDLMVEWTNPPGAVRYTELMQEHLVNGVWVNDGRVTNGDASGFWKSDGLIEGDSYRFKVVSFGEDEVRVESAYVSGVPAHRHVTYSAPRAGMFGKPVTLTIERVKLAESLTISIDWGDGSDSDEFAGNFGPDGRMTVTHIYQSPEVPVARVYLIRASATSDISGYRWRSDDLDVSMMLT